MYWHYQTFKVVVKKGKPYYCVKEVYHGKEGVGWTEDAILPYGMSKDELIKCLEMMLKDVKKYRTKIEKVDK